MRISPDETPASVLIQTHYEALELDKPWGRERVARLCQMLRCTEFELARVTNLNPAKMRHYMERNAFPGEMVLHFALIESWYLSETSKAAQEPIVPMNLLTERISA